MILERLKKHHIGVVVSPQDVQSLEKKFNKKFILDATQGVHVCFVWNEEMGLFVEYITQEGRAKNYSKGFHHICFDVESMEQMKTIETQIKDSKLGFRVTFPERSACQECAMVCFYKIHNLGIVEFNIHD